MKKKKPFLDDWAAPAADVNITARMYERLGNVSYTKWMLLKARIRQAKKMMGFDIMEN